METPPIAATQSPIVAVISGVDVARGILVRATERRLIGENDAIPITATDVSQTGRLLSAVAGIADAANVAEAGAAIDNGAVVDEAQRFVDSVNALSLGGQVTTDILLDIAGGLPVAAAGATSQETEAPGIGVAPLGNDDGSVVLRLDSDVLEAALETDAATATRQLAALAVPVAEAVTSDLAQAPQLLVTSSTTNVQAASQESAAFNPSPIVPDLTVENARLRDALADTMLMDIVSAVSSAASTRLAALEVQNPSVPVAQGGTATATVEDTAPQATTNTTFARLNATSNASAVNGNAMLNPAPAVAQTTTALTPADLITTPLEQIAQLAANPVVAGTVAAFQIPVDDSNRAARVALPSELAVVNPAEAVAATDAIGARLANNSDQRRDNSPDAQVNQWLATRPGLI